jgi:hypothetical protein
MRQAFIVLAILSYVFMLPSVLHPRRAFFFIQKLYNSTFEARFVSPVAWDYIFLFIQ